MELGPIAQRLEQQTHNLLVLGSNPSGPTILPTFPRFSQVSDGFGSNVGSTLTTMLFVLVLPLLLAFLLVPSLPPDDRWFLKMAFTFLGPFSAVLWFITFSNLVLHRRAGYLRQTAVFFGTAALIYLLLIGGVYHL
jgi:hypothetical protein